MDRGAWQATVHGVAKSRTRLSNFHFTSLEMDYTSPSIHSGNVGLPWLSDSLGREDPLKKEMATHSSILAWTIPWTEEPGGLQCIGSQRVGHD